MIQTAVQIKLNSIIVPPTTKNVRLPQIDNILQSTLDSSSTLSSLVGLLTLTLLTKNIANNTIPPTMKLLVSSTSDSLS